MPLIMPVASVSSLIREGYNSYFGDTGAPGLRPET